MDDGNGNFVTLRAYIERVMDEKDKRYQDRWEAQERALEEARRDMERRLQALNELRKEVEADRGQFVKREVFEIKAASFESFKSRAVAIGLALALFSSVVGAFVAHLIGG